MTNDRPTSLLHHADRSGSGGLPLNFRGDWKGINDLTLASMGLPATGNGYTGLPAIHPQPMIRLAGSTPAAQSQSNNLSAFTNKDYQQGVPTRITNKDYQNITNKTTTFQHYQQPSSLTNKGRCTKTNLKPDSRHGPSPRPMGLARLSQSKMEAALDRCSDQTEGFWGLLQCWFIRKLSQTCWHDTTATV